MKILGKSLYLIAIIIAVLIIWVSLMEKQFAEADVDNYIQTSAKLFANAGIQPQSKFIETDGPVKNVHYYEIGSGKPLILIHGGGGYASQWYPIMSTLSETFHLYVVDRPGSGLTDYFDYHGVDLPSHGSDFIRSFMDAAGIEHANIVGHSMGGLFSISFAYEFPHRVDKLILIGHPAGGTQDIPLMMRLLGVKGVNNLLLKMIGTPDIKGSQELHGRLLVSDTSKLSDVYLQHDVNAQLIPGTRKSFISLIENCVGIGGFKKSYLMKSKMQELAMPVFFIIGDKDIWDTMENAKSIVAEMEDGHIEIVKGAGHLPWLDSPEVCSQLISQVLSE